MSNTVPFLLLLNPPSPARAEYFTHCDLKKKSNYVRLNLGPVLSAREYVHKKLSIQISLYIYTV